MSFDSICVEQETFGSCMVKRILIYIFKGNLRSWVRVVKLKTQLQIYSLQSEWILKLKDIFFKNTIFTRSSGFYGLNYCGVVKIAQCVRKCVPFSLPFILNYASYFKSNMNWGVRRINEDESRWVSVPDWILPNTLVNLFSTLILTYNMLL